MDADSHDDEVLDERIRQNILEQEANFRRQKQLLFDMRASGEHDSRDFSLNQSGFEPGATSGFLSSSVLSTTAPLPKPADSPVQSSRELQGDFAAEQESLNMLKQQLGVVQQIRLDHEKKEEALRHLQDEVHELREFKAHADDLADQLQLANESCAQRERELMSMQVV